ncbi:protein of unknown function (DUF928) [Rivularia sp. PCC 7116]|uniref:DUF928 domain-containing protein n=1 Tax=Rivularia sp. PCC 7116 TaxID=373994 RepID=UPI00029F2476|nr:DUF928 domain-containing protein [Rivularia sp. PCC 7116]AFY56418.1 protein of unknown function (DUF928) [Rivularia sp. PCC 7116]
MRLPLAQTAKSIITVSLILSAISQYAPKVVAQTTKPTITKKTAQPSRRTNSRKKKTSQRPVFVSPKAPRKLTPVSGRRAGMGSRNNCPAVPISLTALAPFQQQANKRTNKSDIGIVGGITTLERPKFWFYVPYTKNLANSSAEFSLQDSNGKDIYRDKIVLPQKPGVVGISLPNTVTPLEVGKTYRWYFKVKCSQQAVSLPVYVEGDIQRIALGSRIAEQLRAATDSQHKIAIYAQEGVWFDALNMLAQLRKSSQDASVEQDWQSLLQSVNLDNISTAPLVN